MPISTTLHVEEWVSALVPHPDQAYVEYLIRGMQKGFRIGFEWGKPLESAKSNLSLSVFKPEVISSYIVAELDKG